MKFVSSKRVLAIAAVLSVSAPIIPALAQSGPVASKGYTVSVFAKGNDTYTKPDSIAVANGDIFIGFGGPGLPDGSDGKSSYILEYTVDGQLVHTYSVLGHNDGLKTNPDNGMLYAMQNEDAHPNLVIINPKTRQQSAAYKFASLPPHGGGYDDMVFRNHRLYLSCSNPANNPNARPAIVEVFSYAAGMLHTTETLAGDAWATNVVTGAQARVNLQDPDSMTLDAEGDIFLDSQGDSEVLIVRKPGASDQSVLQIPLSAPNGQPAIDDTMFIPSSDGFALVTDTPNNTVYAIRKAAFVPGEVYSAGQPANPTGTTQGFVGKLDLDSGYITPVVTNLNNPHGLAFIPTK